MLFILNKKEYLLETVKIVKFEKSKKQNPITTGVLFCYTDENSQAYYLQVL